MCELVVDRGHVVLPGGFHLIVGRFQIVACFDGFLLRFGQNIDLLLLFLRQTDHSGCDSCDGSDSHDDCSTRRNECRQDPGRTGQCGCCSAGSGSRRRHAFDCRDDAIDRLSECGCLLYCPQCSQNLCDGLDRLNDHITVLNHPLDRLLDPVLDLVDECNDFVLVFCRQIPDKLSQISLAALDCQLDLVEAVLCGFVGVSDSPDRILQNTKEIFIFQFAGLNILDQLRSGLASEGFNGNFTCLCDVLRLLDLSQDLLVFFFGVLSILSPLCHGLLHAGQHGLSVDAFLLKFCQHSHGFFRGIAQLTKCRAVLCDGFRQIRHADTCCLTGFCKDVQKFRVILCFHAGIFDCPGYKPNSFRRISACDICELQELFGCFFQFGSGEAESRVDFTQG